MRGMICPRFICWMLFELTHLLQSNGHICLKWSFSEGSLKLKCLTSQTFSQISFNNPFNQEQGYCYMPQPFPQCVSYYKNSSITQRLKGTETVFEVGGSIGTNVNGKWSCHHGTNIETAVTNVRIPSKTDYKSHVYLHLTGPKFLRTREAVWLTCISNVPMITKPMQIYVNNIHFKTVTKDGHDCYSSINNDTCKRNECQCSEDGRTYLFKHEGFQNVGLFSIECKAEIHVSMKLSDCMMINVIDIDNPRIVKNKNVPFLASDDVELTCFTFITNTDVQLIWECLDLKPTANFKNSTFIQSVLSLQVTSSMKDKTCTCYAISTKIKTSSSFTIDINKAPVLALISSVVCIQSKGVVLFCNASGELPVKNFGPWVHSYNGYVIRHLKGRRYASTSTLYLDKCSYEDEGDYMCSAWTTEQSVDFPNNISTKVVINGLPFITEKMIFKQPLLTFSVKLYSVPHPRNICWFIENEHITNSTRHVLAFSKTLIERKLHGKVIKTTGYSANLTVKYYSYEKIRKTVAIVVQNDIGNVTEYFENDLVNVSASKLNLKDIYWLLTGSVILILLFAVFGFLCKHHTRRKKFTRDSKLRINDSTKGERDNMNMRTIYDTVVGTDSNTHQYDIAEVMSNYEEVVSIPHNESSTSQQNEYETIDRYEIAHEYIEMF